MAPDSPSETTPDLGPRWGQLAALAVAVLLAMILWFSATAVAPQLSEAWRLGDSQQSWLTISVQLGFVAGTIISAAFNLADRFPVNRLMLFRGAFCMATTLAISSPTRPA